MSALINLSVSADNLAIILDTLKKKGERYFNFTVSVSDETKVFAGKDGKPDTLQNCGCYPSQTKEERDAKKQKWYFANGRVVWTNGKIAVAAKPEENQNAADVFGEIGLTEVKDGDLPF